MQLCNDLNQNSYKIITILIKANLYFLFIQESTKSKFLASFQVKWKSMMMEVILKQSENV